MTDGPDLEGLRLLLDKAGALNALAEIDGAAVEAWGALPEGSAPFVLVKDNIAVAGLQWTAGSPLFADVRAGRDATAVRLLRERGAFFPAKTTLHELAFGVTGANGWTGAIANPHDAGRMAGGSSGGSAAALALGIGDLSLVTDTGGSARIPAALCGVIGFRPSTGRYPSDGVIPLSPSRDTIGLMARELRWIEWADGILGGEDEPLAEPASFRIGIAAGDDLGAVEPDVADAYLHLVRLVEAAGHDVVDVDLSRVTALDEACGFPIALHQSQEALRAFTPTISGRSFEDLLASVATPDVAAILGHAADPATVPVTRYADAIGREWPALREAYSALFADGLDAILLPTVPVVAPSIDHVETVPLNGQPMPTFPTLTRFTRPDSMAGLPSISLPFGKDREGLPIGMMLTGPRHADRALLGLARALLSMSGFPVGLTPNISYS